ncbi:putative CBS domain-containing protein [Plasmopara halstedii]
MSILLTSRVMSERIGALTPALTRNVYAKGLAKDMMGKSCYNGVNFIIPAKATVFEALKRMAGINLGCLAVSGDDGKFVGVVTERDYLKKVELQGLTAKNTLVGQIMTNRARLIVAKANETPSQLMTKMLSSDIRHVPIVNDDSDLIGMLSIKDIVREINREHNADMDTLSNFAMGHGGHFVLD